MLNSINEATANRLMQIKNYAYISIEQSAKKNNISAVFLRRLFRDGKVPGSFRLGKFILIPNGFKYKRVKKNFICSPSNQVPKPKIDPQRKKFLEDKKEYEIQKECYKFEENLIRNL